MIGKWGRYFEGTRPWPGLVIAEEEDGHVHVCVFTLGGLRYVRLIVESLPAPGGFMLNADQ